MLLKVLLRWPEAAIAAGIDEMDPQIVPGQFDEEQDGTAAVGAIDIAGFVLRSARRHLVLAISVGLSVLVLGLLVSVAVPQWYQAEARILVEDSVAKTTALSNSLHMQQTVDPLGESTELVLQKANLAAVVVKADLLADWEATRPLPLRVRDQLVAKVFAGTKESQSDKIDVLAETLASRILIFHDKNVVSVQAQWKDPEHAQRLASILQKELLESLRTQDFSSINAAITLLENQAKQAAEMIPAARDAVTLARNNAADAPPPTGPRVAAGPTATVTVVPITGAPGKGESIAEQGELSAKGSATARGADKKLLAKLSEIREQIKATEIPWQRRLAELKLQKTDMQATYGPEHPLVVQQESRIAVASEPPAELQQFRVEEQNLLSRIQNARDDNSDTENEGQSPGKSHAIRHSFGGTLPKAPINNAREDTNNPAVVAAMAELQAAVAKYTDLAGRVDSARFELTTAQVAFQHRYVVVSEPEIPKRPVRRLRTLIALGGIGAGLLLSLLIGAIRELLAGRIQEAWQIRQMGLTVLGELRLPIRTGNPN